MSYLQLTDESFQLHGRRNDSAHKSVSSKRTNDENDPEGLYNQLIMSKADRLKADQEAKMLKNRIGLLLLEEQKAQKKIEETKKKAKHILELKLQNQQELILREEAKLLKMKQEHEQLLKNKMMRASLSDGKAQATRSHLKKSCERANKVRQEIQECKELSKSFTENFMKKNMAKVTKIKAEQHQSVLRKIQNVEKRVLDSRNYYDNRIKSETEAKNKRTDEIIKLETIEADLIRKLQNTRQEQLSHLEQLEKLKSTKFSFSHDLPEQLDAAVQLTETNQSHWDTSGNRLKSVSAEKSSRFRFE